MKKKALLKFSLLLFLQLKENNFNVEINLMLEPIKFKLSKY